MVHIDVREPNVVTMKAMKGMLVSVIKMVVTLAHGVWVTISSMGLVTITKLTPNKE